MRFIFCLFLIFALTGAVVSPAAAQKLDSTDKRTKREVCDWAPVALTESLSLSHDSFAKDLAAAAVYFTEDGKNSFDLTIANSRLANLVLNSSGAALEAESFGQIRVGKEESHNQWHMSIPMRLTAEPVLTGGKKQASSDEIEDNTLAGVIADRPDREADPLEKPETQEVMIFVKIWDLPSHKKDQDFAIMRFQMTPYLDPEMGKYGISTVALTGCP
ncbi:MAG: DotI/IcmL/TraM family protein [Pseudomonadota bacterium]